MMLGLWVPGMGCSVQSDSAGGVQGCVLWDPVCSPQAVQLDPGHLNILNPLGGNLAFSDPGPTSLWWVLVPIFESFSWAGWLERVGVSSCPSSLRWLISACF